MKKIYILCLVLIVIIIIFFIINKKQEKQLIRIENNVNNEIINYEFNEESMTYEIHNDKGEIIGLTEDEDDAKFMTEFYKRNPEYRIESPSLISE